MTKITQTLLYFALYNSLLIPAYASVSGEDDQDKESLYSQGFSESSRSSGKKSIKSQAKTFSDHDFTVDDDESIRSFSTAGNRGIEKRGQKLNQIYTLKSYFKKGFLEITPESYKGLLEHTLLYTTAFESYDRGIALRGWSEKEDTKELFKLLNYFNVIQSVKCRKNTWQGKVLMSILSDAIQHYEALETLDLKDSILGEKDILKLLKVLPKPGSLKTLNIQASTLSLQARSEIKKKYSNLAEFIVGTEAQELSAKPEPKAVKGTPVAIAEIKIEELEEPKTPSLKPLYSPSPGEQNPLVKTAAPQVIDSNNNNVEEKITAPALAKSSRKLTNEDIVEALNKVNAKTLSIEDCTALVKSDPTLTSLSLSGNQIGPEGAKALAPSLTALTSLTALSFYDTQIGVEGVKALAPALKALTSLEKLSLGTNKIGDEGTIALAPSLKDMKLLKVLDLYSNQIGTEGAKALAPALKNFTALTVLGLSFNPIGTEGAKALAPALKDLTTLTELEFSQNEIGDEGAKALALALKALTSLTKLGFYYNQIGPEGAKALAPALKNLRALFNLSFSTNKIGNEGAQALAPALKDLTTIRWLFLSGNQIGAEGVKALAPALKALTTNDIHGLDLSGNQIDAEGAQALALALIPPPPYFYSPLTTLDLQSNKIGDEGVKALVPTLTKLVNIETLGLGCNQIGDEGAKALASALTASLRNLFLGSNQIGGEGKRALENLKSSKPFLKTFY